MFCNKCGTENEDGSKFCSSCGNNLEGVQTKGVVENNPVQSGSNRGDDEFYGLNKTKTKDEEVDNEIKTSWGSKFTQGLIYVFVGLIVLGWMLGDEETASSTSSITSSSGISTAAAAPTVNNKEILDEVWKGYRQSSGLNDEYVDLKGNLIAKGTVPPSAMNSLVSERLPAYLACYDYISVTAAGDLEWEMCVYYVTNPTRGRFKAKWRGPQYLGELKSSMSQDGFQES